MDEITFDELVDEYDRVTVTEFKYTMSHRSGVSFELDVISMIVETPDEEVFSVTDTPFDGARFKTGALRTVIYDIVKNNNIYLENLFIFIK